MNPDSGMNLTACPPRGLHCKHWPLNGVVVSDGRLFDAELTICLCRPCFRLRHTLIRGHHDHIRYVGALAFIELDQRRPTGDLGTHDGGDPSLWAGLGEARCWPRATTRRSERIARRCQPPEQRTMELNELKLLRNTAQTQV